jgi:hypothetical protein
MFQLLISFKKRNNKPKRLRKTAKLLTTVESIVAAAYDVAIICCSLELKQSLKCSVSPLES